MRLLNQVVGIKLWVPRRVKLSILLPPHLSSLSAMACPTKNMTHDAMLNCMVSEPAEFETRRKFDPRQRGSIQKTKKNSAHDQKQTRLGVWTLPMRLRADNP
jgi:hypothetical protein